MATSKAIDLLKECLGEIAKLKERRYDNNPEFSLWHEKVNTILTKAFPQVDYKKFARSWPDYSRFSHHDGQIEYLRLLQHYETALKSIIQKYEIREKLGSKEEPVVSPSDINELPIYLFNNMQLHPKIIKSSEALFKDRHYASAILEAFKAVNNFVKEKSGLSSNELRGMKDRPLMAKAFDEKEPLIKLNELITDTDINEQEGFKLLFMGATEGIRNPKAHDLIEMKDPYKTLEYLAFASLLMRTVEESTVVKTSLPRTKWDWDRFLADTKSKCELGIVRLAVNLYEFTRSNSDFISWGTGNQDGSFTFRKLGLGGMISIFSMYSCGWIYINFGSLKNKNVPDNIMDSFRDNLNTVQNINIPKESVTNGKFARIYEKPLTNSKNLKLFQDAVISLGQQLDSNKETSS